MTSDLDNPEFEYDLALSFAGEDRAYAHAIAERLRRLGISVFYDEYAVAEMWGADLPVFFDEVFRKKTRYAALFISRHYVEKVWPRYEARSVQARALVQTSPFLLPIRLDDSELPGLQPTVGYVDARETGREKLIELVLAKLAETRPIERVPRSPEEEAALRAAHPPAWGYLLFAAVLLRERDVLETKWRDHEIRFARATGPALDDTGAMELVSGVFEQARFISENISRLFSPDVTERTFGPHGETGDADQIEHLARRIITVYEDFLDWAANLRGTPVPDRFQPVFEVASRFVDGPVRQIREFVDNAVEQLDALPALLRAESDDPIQLKLSLVLDMDEGLTESLQQEFRQLEASFGISR